MSRFPFALLLLLTLLGNALPAGAAEPKRPNIVVMVADDWGFSDVGSFGSEIATPNLDALARSGMRFSNFHVAAECSPTRAMLMTGVDSHRTGVGAMRESVPRSHYGKPGYLTVLNQNVVTVSSLLQDGGYRTYAVGKCTSARSRTTCPTPAALTARWCRATAARTTGRLTNATWR